MSVKSVKLAEVAEINPRFRNGATEHDEEVAFVPMAAVSAEMASIEVLETRPLSTVLTGFTYFQDGDLLLAKITPCFENGKIAHARIEHQHGFGSTEFHVIRPEQSQLNARYLLHFLRQPTIRIDGERKMTGSAGQRRVPKHFVEDLDIPLPPLREQQRIATILDHTEALRGKRRSALAKLDLLPQSLFLDLFGDPKKNERGWEIVPVGEAGRVQLGRQRAPQYQSGNFTRPYVRVANVYEDQLDLSDVLSMDFDAADFEAYRLNYGDILLNEGQSTELVGRPAMWRSEITNCCFQNTLVRFQANPETTLPEFALAVFIRYLRSGEFAKVSSKTSNVAHLGASRFAAMPFPLPPIERQREFESRMAVVRQLKASQEASLKEMDALFASLQHRAFRGEL